MPGPRYSGKNAGKGETTLLACKAKGERIDFRGLCGIDAVNRVRIGVELGYLPRMEGKKCPHECGTKLSLQATGRVRSPGITVSVGNVEAPVGIAQCQFIPVLSGWKSQKNCVRWHCCCYPSR